MFLTQKVFELIFSEYHQSPENPSELGLNFSSSGPGRFTPWRLLDGSDDLWANQTMAATRESPKIIFCEPLLIERPPNELELIFFNELCKYYPIYLWPGNEKKLVDCQALSNSHQFWNLRNQTYAAHRNEVIKAIADQGLDPSNYIILDYENYYSLLLNKILPCFNMQQQHRNNPHLINIFNYQNLCLTFFPLTDQNIEKITRCISPEIIKFIIFPDIATPSQQEKLLNFFNLTHNSDAAYLNPDNHGVYKLKNSHDIKALINSADKEKIYSLEILPETSPFSLDGIEELPNLYHISFRFNLDEIDVSPLSKCQKLTNISFNNTISAEQIAKLPKLSHLDILETNLEKFISNYPYLSSIEALYCTCAVNSSPEIQLQFVTKLKSLRYLHLFMIAKKAHKIDFHHFSSLENLAHLTIQHNGAPEKVTYNLNCLAKLNKIEYLNFITDSKNYEILGLENLNDLPLKILKFFYPNYVNQLLLPEIQFADCEISFFIRQGQDNHLAKVFPKMICAKISSTIQVQSESYLDFSHHQRLEKIELSLQNIGANLLIYNNLALKKIASYNENLSIHGLETCHDLRYITISSKSTDYRIQELTNKLPKLTYFSFDPYFSSPHSRPANSSTSNYHAHSSTTIDANTGEKNTVYSAPSDGFKVVFSDHNSSPADNSGKSTYRINVYDLASYNIRTPNIRFSSDLSQLVSVKNIAESHREVKYFAADWKKSYAHQDVGYFEGFLNVNQFYPLPSKSIVNLHSIKDILGKIYSNPDQQKNINLTLHWHPQQGQYYICLISQTDHPPVKVEILYALEKNPHYTKSINSEKERYLTIKKNLLPKIIADKFEQLILANPNLNEIFGSSKNIEKKIEALIEYFSGFKNEPLNATFAANNQLAIFQAILNERKGACRHRAILFFILARKLGVPVNMVYNEIHAFCEIPCIANGTVSYRKIDLGGAPVIDLTSPSLNCDIFNSDFKSQEQILPDPKHTEVYYAKLARELQNFILDSYERVIIALHGNLPALVYLNNHNQKIAYSFIIQALKSHYGSAFKNYIYIHKASDFTRYLAPKKVTENSISSVAGPLLKILEEGGILIINWANFSEQELACFKSILDAQPTLKQYAIDPFKVKIIGFTDKISCPSFVSRCKAWDLTIQRSDLQLSARPASSENHETEDSVIKVDLFKNKLWQDFLFGDFKISRNNFCLVSSGIIQAIQERKNLIIYNPPETDDFKMFIQQVLVERRFLYNGNFLDLPEQMQIRIESYFATPKIENQLDFVLDIEPDSHLIYINNNNFHELFQQIHINDSGSAEEYPGLINSENINSIFCFTEKINDSNLMQLSTWLRHNYPATKLKIFTGGKNSSILEHNMIASNDPDFLSESLEKRLDAIIVDVTTDTIFSDLFYSIKTELTEDGLIKFNFQSKPILNFLLSGKNVILNGEISPILYQQLLPWLNPSATKIINSQKINLRGKLNLVIPKYALSQYPWCKKEYICNLIEYSDKFSDSEQKIIANISKLFEFINRLPHHGLGRPKKPELNFYLLKNMLSAAQTKLHQQNPLKETFLYNYPKDSSEYAYLNVLTKIIFYSEKSHASEESKLFLKLSKIIALVNCPQTRNIYLWQALNCLDSSHLSEIAYLIKTIQSPLDMEANSSELEILCQFINQKHHELSQKFSQLETSNKQLCVLHNLLSNDKVNFIFMKGEPGSGKTYTIRKLKSEENICYYEGENQLEDFLGDTNKEKIKILLLDEANCKHSGFWDFLKGISRDQKSIFYKGNVYYLDANHKVIFTGNPESYPNRNYFLSNHTSTIYFNKISEDFIARKIIAPILATKIDPENLDKIIATILAAYKIIQEENKLRIFSIRDLENLSQRFLINLLSKSIHDSLYLACHNEFAPGLNNLEKKMKFSLSIKKIIEENFSCSLNIQSPADEVIQINHIVWPASKAYLIEALRENLALRNLMIKDKIACKSGVLIEGDSGIGKSTLFKNFLESQGFSQQHTDPQQRYYEISVGTNSTYQILLKAFNEGAVVILDELNLDPNLELLLNSLLSGVDLAGNPAATPGFMVFSSQNPGYFAGRKALSPALQNRFHFMHLENFTRHELIALARYHKISYPENFVDAFLSLKAKYPNLVNLRTFYTKLKAYCANPLDFSSASALATAPEFTSPPKSPARIPLLPAGNDYGVNILELEEPNNYALAVEESTPPQRARRKRCPCVIQ